MPGAPFRLQQTHASLQNSVTNTMDEEVDPEVLEVSLSMPPLSTPYPSGTYSAGWLPIDSP